MASHNNKGRSKRTPGGYVTLPNFVLGCEAWRALSAHARVLYPHLKARYRDYGKGKTNNGRIAYSRREAMRDTGFAEGTISKAFADLEAKGFIKIARASKYSGFSLHNSQSPEFRQRSAQAREYILAEYGWGDKPPSKDFMKWSPKRDDKKQNAGASLAPVGCTPCTTINTSSLRSGHDGNERAQLKNA